MDSIRIIIWIILLLLWLVGSFLPTLPGPILTFLALIILQIGTGTFDNNFLIIWWVITVFVTLVDYIIPIIGTKKLWWTKWGTRWSTVGLVVWIIILPMLGIVIWPFGLIGLIWWPFLWAYIWENLHNRDQKKALKSAIGSFLGFLTWTFLKLVVWAVIVVYFFRESFGLIKNMIQ